MSESGLGDEDYVRAVAMAIAGPHSVMSAGSRYTLHDLRVVRWLILSDQERSYLMWQARAAISQAAVTEKDEVGNYPASGLPS